MTNSTNTFFSNITPPAAAGNPDAIMQDISSSEDERTTDLAQEKLGVSGTGITKLKREKPKTPRKPASLQRRAPQPTVAPTTSPTQGPAPKAPASIRLKPRPSEGGLQTVLDEDDLSSRIGRLQV